MTNFVYGKSRDGKYAVASKGSEVWAATEALGELYRIIEFDEIPEIDWERIEALEKSAEDA